MTPAEKQQQKEQALKTLGALGTAGIAVPLGTSLPFIRGKDFYSGNLESKIKQQEALRMFPGADPNLFNTFDPEKSGFYSGLNVVPTSQEYALKRVFNNVSTPFNEFALDPSVPQFKTLSFPTSRPGAPSPELGSYQKSFAYREAPPQGEIQAITVTPGPDPSRFAKDYVEILADKLGKTLNEFETGKEWNNEAARQARKISALSSKIPGTAGYVWGNTDYPQYSYAEGNWGLGQKLAGENPSIYLSRINADPFKEAKYLYTGDVLPAGQIEEKEYITVDPRAKFKQYEELGPGTGPSWGVAPNK